MWWSRHHRSWESCLYRLSALGSRLSALGSRLSALGSPSCAFVTFVVCWFFSVPSMVNVFRAPVRYTQTQWEITTRASRKPNSASCEA
jgi:hypothetical protein